MIVTEIYNGQGLGNQLWCYVVTRTIAKKHGYDFGIMHPEKFKCLDFMNLDFGKEVIGGTGPEGGVPRELPKDIGFYYNEHAIKHPATGADIRVFDPLLASVPDGTKIDGIMQDEQYIADYKDEIRTWLRVRPDYIEKCQSGDDICIINFRGGEYTRIKDVFLPKKYWEDAIAHMRSINPLMRFVVVTDDVVTARTFFPDFEISHTSIGHDYATIYTATYLILSNSSFAWFPAWLSTKTQKIIAPKYWASHNISDGYWSTGGSLTHGFTYLDRAGVLSTYEDCLKEYIEYKKSHAEMYSLAKVPDAFVVVSNYYNDLSWVPYATSNYLIYDQSAMPILSPYIDRTKVIPSEHRGHNIRDYCTYIIDHYDNLPDRVLLCAGNVFPRHVDEAYFKKAILQEGYVPLFQKERHHPRMPVAFIDSDGLYAEYNSSWYVKHHPTKYVRTYNDFMRFIAKNPELPDYVHFATGANYLVTKEQILHYPKAFYENLRLFVSHTDTAIAGESHIIERALHTIWSDTFELSENIRSPLPDDFKGVPHCFETPSPRSLYVMSAARLYALSEKIRYLARKVPSLTQYFTGKRDIRDLWKRIRA